MIHSSQFEHFSCTVQTEFHFLFAIILLYYMILQHLLLPREQLGALASALLEIDLYYDCHTFANLLIGIRGTCDSSVQLLQRGLSLPPKVLFVDLW